MIIAVADLHLGSQLANKAGFSDFISNYLEPNQDEISRIVLLGDILDLWRNTNSQVLLQNLDVLSKLGRLDMKKNYLAGNHDFAIFSLLGHRTIQVPPDSIGVLDQVSETLEITSDGLKLKFLHGHQIDYWSALKFYEAFSQAMCFVDDTVGELADVWTIIDQFAEDLPEGSQNKLRNLSRGNKLALEQKLAGPIDGSAKNGRAGLSYEWELLGLVSDFEDVSRRSGKPLKAIEQFVQEWKRTCDTVDLYQESPFLPPQIALEVHDTRRIAADLSVGLHEDEFLIRGHGHTPYISQEARVADAGCWLGEQGSYLKIIDGQVTLHRW